MATTSELPEPVERTGAQILWETLLAEGVDVVFGYPGGAILPVYDAMLEYPVRHVLVRHEQGAAHMADGYARASGKVGVAIASSGPGATNLVTGIATAMLDSVPMVCITGQVRSKLIGTDAFQEADITGITLPITKHNYLVTRAEDVGPTLREAFYIARTGRAGPVLVDITKDAQQGRCLYVPGETPARLAGYQPRVNARGGEIEQAIKLIAGAARPIILAGHGIVSAGASDELREFAERLDIPVASTLLGLGGFPATHRLALGMMGMHGEEWVNQAIQEADLLIAFGMRFDERVTGDAEAYAPQAKKIHCELDLAEINKVVKVDVPLVGDAREVLAELLRRVKKKDHSEWILRITGLKGDASVRDIVQLPDTGRLFAAQVIHDLWRITQGKAIVVTDVGQHQMWEAQYYKHNFPRGLITSGGLGTMGFALPAAIGARLAVPDQEIWVIVGDGGFQMTSCELTTCAQENIKLNVAIINNGYLGMIRQLQELFYDQRYNAAAFKSPDFVKLAEAHDLTAYRVHRRDEIEGVVARARAAPGTVVIDFRVEEEDTVYPTVPAGAPLSDMIRRPRPPDPDDEGGE